MKTKSSLVLVGVGLLFLASAPQMTAEQPKDPHSKAIYANSLADGGSIRLKHSPVTGMNVTISISIDGVYAGTFAKGHVFERFLTPGRHTLAASRRKNEHDTWRGTLDVKRGQIYSFVVKVTTNEVVLQPTGRID